MEGGSFFSAIRWAVTFITLHYLPMQDFCKAIPENAITLMAKSRKS